MASKYFKFSGKCMWAQLQKPDPKYDNYKVTLIMDGANLEKLKQSGLQLEPKMTDDGVTVTFRRPSKKLIKSEIVEFGPPKVSGNPDNKLVGNGSTVEVDVVVYDTMKGKGHRLEAVKVLDLVEYVKPSV